ncbi:hypothetical protein KC363_g5897 [Hortaea werneckii]|uniref:Methyltransferase domain-containing protein n=1 Tax=Hortaea werneckii TaxID=91943 RepID=A0A3M7EXJ1_HORWE|nr:hypothetical protein KC361_g5620 [Hortaea werneckii]KAI6882867.1 hypothetical protein KC325_g5479 [Hortaea werneckii]KAI6991925.1 hypothetical protein KC359_g5963 [Hortaea werneckii]KAI7144736.1 hypothetical protein KC344_g5149 [Hortaea werneckii]KAI7172051.1 hypothetical protein KC360_g5755 [Hortaea werneckii]
MTAQQSAMQSQTGWDKFFSPQLELSDGTREVFETYSKIPPNEVMNHCYAIREKAWSIHPYPCIGMGRFLQMAIGNHHLYQSEILPRMLKGDQKYLDLGCAFAQDIRRLVADGVDSRNCYGADLQLDFLDLGYELFRDRETLQSTFITADIFDPASGLMGILGTIDFVDASSFFHLFSWDDQKAAAHTVTKLLKPQKDSLVVGRQMGHVDGGDFNRPGEKGLGFRHNAETWRRMWDEVGKEAGGVQFNAEAILKSIPREMKDAMQSQSRPEDEGNVSMEFSVRRLN